MRDVLTRIPELPTEKLDELLPDQWQAEPSKKKNQNTTAQAVVPSVPANAAA
ncbi:MAG: hypothetical protein ACP5QA_08730 [Phycisphaerae bacterium]